MMLEFLRQRTKSWLIYLMFGVIIAVFILTFNPVAGKGGQCGGVASPLLAQVGESRVDLNTLYMGLALTADPAGQGGSSQASQQDYIYRNTRFYYSGVQPQFLPFNPTPEGVSPIKIQKVMNDLIETITVSDLATRMGLAVSVDEVTNRILGTQRFTNPDTGEFDSDAYSNFVRYTLKTTKPRYEDFIRRELLRERVIQSVESTVNVAPAEIDFYVKSMTDTVNLEYVELSSDLLSKGVSTTPEQDAEYAAANSEAVNSFFDENKARFSKPERVKVRGIFFKAPFRFFRERLTAADQIKDHDDQWAAAKASAEAALKSLSEAPAVAEGSEAAPTDNFAQLASEKSEHPPSKAEGGLFDKEFSKDELSRWPFGAEVGEKAFGLDKGTVSEIVAADNGYWILRIEDRLPAFEKSLEDVRPEIAQELLRLSLAEKELDAATKALIEAAKKDGVANLTEAVESWRSAKGEGAPLLAVRETGAFGRIPDGPIPPVTDDIGKIPGVGKSRTLVESAFNLTVEAPVGLEAFKVEGQENRVYVIRLKEKVQDQADSATVDRVTKALSNQQARSSFRDLVSQLRRGAEQAGELSFSDEFNTMMAQEVKNLEAAVPAVN